jgi:hypothetical protein
LRLGGSDFYHTFFPPNKPATFIVTRFIRQLHRVFQIHPYFVRGVGVSTESDLDVSRAGEFQEI